MATQSPTRTEIDLPAGRIRYREAGEGKPVVFVHGYLVDGRLWDGVVDSLSGRYRCLAPDWPIGSQQIAMNADADLSPYGIAATIAELPGGTRPRGRDDRRQRQRRRHVPGARHPSPGADRSPRPDQLRHPRELPTGPVQGHAWRSPSCRAAESADRAASDRGGRPRRVQALLEEADPAGPDPLVDRARAQRPRCQARSQEGDRRDEQALHARGRREAASLGAADPARLGAEGPRLPAQVRRKAGGRSPATPASSRSPTPAPSSPSTSLSGWRTRSRPSPATG